MRKSNIAFIALVIVFFGSIFLAFNAHNNYQKSVNAFTKSQAYLTKAQNKADTMVTGVGKNQIYIKAKGATTKNDPNSKELNTILQKTFNFNNLDQFSANATYVIPKVSGNFYSYWFKGGIKANRESLEAIAKDGSVSRFGDINLTRFDNDHYFAIVKTGLLIGTQTESDVQPVLFGLNITRKGNVWNVDKLSNFDNINNGTNYSNADKQHIDTNKPQKQV